MHVVALVVLCMHGPGLMDQTDLHGKTEAQILAMGVNKWDAFYLKQVGSSTADMVEMNSIYGEALKHRNDRLAKVASKKVQGQITQFRTLLTAFADAAIDVGYNITGGGTIWSPVSAYAETDIELVIYGMLDGPTPRAKHLTVSVPEKQIDAVSKAVAAEHADSSAATYFNFPRAKKSLADLRAAYTKLVKAASGMPRSTSDHILGFCLTYAKLAKGDWS